MAARDYDFGQAVMTLASTIEAKARETETVEVEDGPKAPKGYHFEQKPKHTLRELLLEASGAGDANDEALPDELTQLPTAWL